jgi:hypothetical protein
LPVEKDLHLGVGGRRQVFELRGCFAGVGVLEAMGLETRRRRLLGSRVVEKRAKQEYQANRRQRAAMLAPAAALKVAIVFHHPPRPAMSANANAQSARPAQSMHQEYSEESLESL